MINFIIKFKDNKNKIMQMPGFEPGKALSHVVLSHTRLTAPAHLLELPYFFDYYKKETTESFKNIRFI